MKNIESYSDTNIVAYYDYLTQLGLFSYEKTLFQKFIKNNDKILDIGCGCGRICKYLENTCNVTGIDYSSEMINKAKQNTSKTKLMVLDVLNLNVIKNKFNVIICAFNTLMLIKEYDKRLNTFYLIKKHLFRDGYFIFTTPYLDNKIKTAYWSSKISSFNKNLIDFSFEELLELGNEIIEENSVVFNIHIPFLNEVYKIVYQLNLEIVFAGRRIDLFGFDKFEDQLDDNYIWVVKKK